MTTSCRTGTGGRHPSAGPLSDRHRAPQRAFHEKRFLGHRGQRRAASGEEPAQLRQRRGRLERGRRGLVHGVGAPRGRDARRGPRHGATDMDRLRAGPEEPVRSNGVFPVTGEVRAIAPSHGRCFCGKTVCITVRGPTGPRSASSAKHLDSGRSLVSPSRYSDGLCDSVCGPGPPPPRALYPGLGCRLAWFSTEVEVGGFELTYD